MRVWVLTRPPLGRGRDGDNEENGVDVSINDLSHLSLLEGPLKVIWVTADKHLREGERGERVEREGGGEGEREVGREGGGKRGRGRGRAGEREEGGRERGSKGRLQRVYT